LYVRYTGSQDEIVPAVSRALRAVDDRAPIVYLRTMEEQLASLTWPIHALAVLLASFAIGSLMIATIGQYAAVAFTMRRRSRDFGVRLALGASSADILSAVVREGLRLTIAGLAIGCALSLATATGLRSMLFGVTPTDLPPTPPSSRCSAARRWSPAICPRAAARGSTRCRRCARSEGR
jgi:predicted lysophospholipase L1 biosynthesis ABC-type transport system permease subunit